MRPQDLRRVGQGDCVRQRLRGNRRCRAQDSLTAGNTPPLPSGESMRFHSLLLRRRDGVQENPTFHLRPRAETVEMVGLNGVTGSCAPIARLA